MTSTLTVPAAQTERVVPVATVEQIGAIPQADHLRRVTLAPAGSTPPIRGAMDERIQVPGRRVARGRHRLGGPGLIPVAAFVRVVYRGMFASWRRPGKHRVLILAHRPARTAPLAAV